MWLAALFFGSAGARISFNSCSDPEALQSKLLEFFKKTNPFNLKITLRRIEADSKNTSFDLVLTSSTKDPHSGMNGGPFPIAELQLARMINQLVSNGGSLAPEIQKVCGTSSEKSGIKNSVPVRRKRRISKNSLMILVPRLWWKSA